MHAYYRKKATECNPALGGLIFFCLLRCQHEKIHW
nr:MAG TPA_asm: SCIMP protein [Caudoviricetes sp.]